MAGYILLSFSIVFAAMNNYLIHKYSEKNPKSNIFLFNTLVSFVWIIMLLTLEKKFDVSKTTFIYGIIYGSIIAFFLLFKTASMSTGSISFTALIGCCSLLVPTLFGIFYWKETVHYSQICGLVLLMISLYICINPQKDKSISKKWIIFSFLFFLFAGICGIIIKMYQKTYVSSELNMMMIIASIMAFIIFQLFFFFSRKRKNVVKIEKQNCSKFNFLFILLCGIVSCGYQRLNLYLVGILPSIVFFPVFNGAVIFLSFIAGIVLFREKMKVIQICGLITGFISIILIGNVF